jgi:L-cysteine S-thiosulfotransferase
MSPHLDRSKNVPLRTIISMGVSLVFFCSASISLAQSISGPGAIAPEQLRSGVTFASEAIATLQKDDDLNPGFLWVEQGQKSWQQNHSSAKDSCESCHQDPNTSMRGVTMKYPRFDDASHQLVNLEAQINRCRVNRQHLPALKYESDELLGLTAVINLASRGMVMQKTLAPNLIEPLKRGQTRFETRRGQINLACMHCHTQNYGNHLGGETLSQGQPVGYPAYRLEWQKMGSLHRRLRACLSGVKAYIYPFGSQELMELELYLGFRAQGLTLEAPEVRR